MKKIIFFAILGLFLQAPIPAEAQIFKKITEKVKKKAERKADQKIDKTIDEGFEETEDILTKKKADSIEQETKAEDKREEPIKVEGQQQEPKASELTLNWS